MLFSLCCRYALCSLFSTRQHDWSTSSVNTTTLHHCCSNCTGCQCQNEWLSNFVSWYIAVCMVSALNTCRRTSSSCLRFILASDCVRPPHDKTNVPLTSAILRYIYLLWLAFNQSTGDPKVTGQKTTEPMPVQSPDKLGGLRQEVYLA